jgi:excinuclease ABC subunit B
MQRAIDETERRRATQQAYNQQHGITPETIRKSIHTGIESQAAAHRAANAAVGRKDDVQIVTEEYIQELQEEMVAAAEALEFERAAAIRDRITNLRDAPETSAAEAGPRHRGLAKSGRGGRRRGGSRVPRPKKP